MIATIVLLAQTWFGGAGGQIVDMRPQYGLWDYNTYAATVVISSEARYLTGPRSVCSGEIDPQLGAYSVTLWMPAAYQRWSWTYLEEPFYGRTMTSGCKVNCQQKWQITRFAPYSSSNVVPDAYRVAFSCADCYHVILMQGGQSRDLCNR